MPQLPCEKAYLKLHWFETFWPFWEGSEGRALAVNNPNGFQVTLKLECGLCCKLD